MKLRSQIFRSACSVPRSESARRSGVALIITLILISVITFMAITFLAISRRERQQTITSLDQTTARLAADAAYERAAAELLAAILSTTNAANFNLLVSTNMINWAGYDPAAVDWRTNINYDYRVGGAPLTAAEQLQNLNNLFFNPRPPVFVTNKFWGSNEFRFYVDLNRDNVYTTNGLLPVISDNPGLPYYDTNGNLLATLTPGITLSNYFTGDPEFIGGLVRPEFPHSSSNQFNLRYAFIVIPAGKTLDVNYIHNYAKGINPPMPIAAGDMFARNQAVGSWENNFAGFLRDLNTNVWDSYVYVAPPTNAVSGPVRNTGLAFDDAVSLLRYRYSYNNAVSYNNLYDVNTLLGASGANAFRFDFMDGFGSGPLMASYSGWSYPVDPDIARIAGNRRWPGSRNPSHVFTTQDFLDKSKTQIGYAPNVLGFTDRLLMATTNSPSSYSRYTYYRLLSQLGTDSAPEPPGKMNLNYDNLVSRHPVSGLINVTNFIEWQALAFFTNAAERLVRAQSGGKFGIGDIPVFTNGVFAYSPSLNRQLQLAANMWDAIHNTNYYPTVFRPHFKTVGSDVFISGFSEVTDTSFLTSTMRELSTTNVAMAVQTNDLIYGVPLIVGAKKGLPNFNEFSTESVFQITRKVELVKSTAGGGDKITQTNQMFNIGISNVFGAEFWNSYGTNFSRQVDIYVTNVVTVALTNDYGYNYLTNLIAGGYIGIPGGGITAWPQWKGGATDASFLVPLRSNHIVIPDLVYRQNARRFEVRSEVYERPSGFAFPRWGMTITNRVQAMVIDRSPGPGFGRVLDYVQLSGLSSYRDLSGEIAQVDKGPGFDSLWTTNALGAGGLLSDQRGIIYQIEISKGNNASSTTDWNNYGIGQATGATKAKEIAKFLAFFTGNHLATFYDPSSGVTFSGSNGALTAIAPFSPTRKISVPFYWQANDPLVHYTSGDMRFLERSDKRNEWNPPGRTNVPVLVNLGRLNDRYQPWGGNPQVTAGGTDLNADPLLAVNLAIKDPGATSSEAWQFPTNKLPTLGWLGRIHRGTPWQTVYLKSPGLADSPGGALKDTHWQNWSGNLDANDAKATLPEFDRNLFDLFTTTLNDDASRGQLPINQSGLAAWSAVFSGMVALTNSSTDADLANIPPLRRYDPWIIDPAGLDPTNSPLGRIVTAINDVRATNTARFPKRTFERLGDILAVPELTVNSPFLNQSSADQKNKGLNDAVYEWLPQQMMSLVRLGEPRFVVYSYGQALKPAGPPYQGGGAYFGMVTNYAIAAEVVTRAVVRVEGAPDKPRVVVESYNVLPPE